MHRDIVVVGGSAGALEPLKQVVAGLPADLGAAVLVVLHLAATSRSALASILDRVGGLPAVVPRDGDPLRPGFIYVPTPDHHLELRDGTIAVTRGPRINGVRPSVDVLFRSAASAYGPRVVGVVLSGGLDDGSAGLAAIRSRGGVGIVQRPDDAVVDSMPRSAIEVASPEHVLPADRIGPKIVEVFGERADAHKLHQQAGGSDMEAVGARDTEGQVTGVTCPDCHGSIWMQKGEGGEVAYTCRVGHSYSPESFFEIQAENVENALWAGVRSLEEQAATAASLSTRARGADEEEAAQRYERRRRVADQNAEALRRLLLERSEA